MWGVFVVVLLTTLATVRADEIHAGVKRDPDQKAYKCGDMVTFTWELDEAGKVPDGTVLQLGFKQDPAFGSVKWITRNVGTTAQGPSASFTYTFPNPLPPAFTEGEQFQVKNDGKAADIFLWIARADDPDVNNDAGLFEGHEDFKLSCCPAGMASCECRADGGCDNGLACVADGDKSTCKEPMEGKEGHPCKPDGSCDGANVVCQNQVCVSMGRCEAAGQTRENGLWSTGPESGCPCGDIEGQPRCASPLTCNNNEICVGGGQSSGGGTPLMGRQCVAAVDVAAAKNDICMTDAMGSVATAPLSCQQNSCQPCTAGSAYCICSEGACNNGATCQAADGAAMARCFPATGCRDCPCASEFASQRCQQGLTCLSSTCKMATPQDTGNPDPNQQESDTMTCTQNGTEGCPCAVKSNGQKGCVKVPEGEKQPVCKEVDGVDLCVSSGSSMMLAFIASLAAFAAWAI